MHKFEICIKNIKSKIIYSFTVKTSLKNMSGFPKASEIRRTAKGAGYVEDYIRDVLNLIKDDILAAVERRDTESVTALPTDFSIPTMDPIEAQRMVYYYVAKKLESPDLGYMVNFVFKGQNTENQKWWIRVRWLTENDNAARQYMDQYIKSRTERAEPVGDETVVSHRRRPKKPVAKARPRRTGDVVIQSDNPDLQDIILLN